MFQRIIITIALIFAMQNSYPQFGSYKLQEFGITAGPVFFQSDFGERGSFKNAVGNVGFNLTGFYYIPLSPYRTNFTESFKIRGEINFMTTGLRHFGKYVDSDTQMAKKLEGMRSKVTAASIGIQVEYYPWRTEEYYRHTIFYPYLSAGTHFTSYSANAYSKNGPIGIPQTSLEKYIDGFKSTSGTTMSVSGSLGTRIKFDDKNGIVIDGRLQYYFTDWMDGMNPSRRTYTENKTNDWSATLNIGYIHIID